MSNPDAPEVQPCNEGTESFKDVLSEYERGRARKPEPGSSGREGTVIAVTADSIILDIGFKTEGILPISAELNPQTVKPGDKLLVTVKGEIRRATTNWCAGRWIARRTGRGWSGRSPRR